jgi:hypothetical protein
MWTEPDFIIGISLLVGAALYLTGLERGGSIERAKQKLRLRTHPPNVDDWAAGWWASGGSLAAGKWAADSMGPDCGL